MGTVLTGAPSFRLSAMDRVDLAFWTRSEHVKSNVPKIKTTGTRDPPSDCLAKCRQRRSHWALGNLLATCLLPKLSSAEYSTAVQSIAVSRVQCSEKLHTST